MWFLWLVAFVVLCLAGMIVFWVGHKIWIATQKDQKKFENEFKKAEDGKDE